MADHLGRAPEQGSPERLVALGRGYRDFAPAEPAFFALMFGRAVPGFTPSRATRDAGRRHAIGQVVQEAQHCLDAGTLVAVDATALARVCWVTAHGMAALEVAGLLAVEDIDALAETALRGPVEAHRRRPQAAPS